jgi:hypothetical protein
MIKIFIYSTRAKTAIKALTPRKHWFRSRDLKVASNGTRGKKSIRRLRWRALVVIAAFSSLFVLRRRESQAIGNLRQSIGGQSEAGGRSVFITPML